MNRSDHRNARVVVVDLDDARDFRELVSLYLHQDLEAVTKIGVINSLQNWIEDGTVTELPMTACLPDTQGCRAFAAVTPYSIEPQVFLSGSVSAIESLLGLATERKPTSLHKRLDAIREKALQTQTRIDRYADIELDNVSHSVSVHEIDLRLTPTEYQLMRLFINNPRKVLTRERLLVAMSGDRSDASDRSVDTHIKNLRKKIRDAGAEGVEIRSVYGLGYRLV